MNCFSCPAWKAIYRKQSIYWYLQKGHLVKTNPVSVLTLTEGNNPPFYLFESYEIIQIIGFTMLPKKLTLALDAAARKME